MNIQNFNELFERHSEFAKKTFPKMTTESCLIKLEGEIKEVRESLLNGVDSETVKEYADCFLCLISSMTCAGIHPDALRFYMANKIALNETREWKLNPDNTYSHVK